MATMSNACGRCGRDPAAGFAVIEETRYCHEGESPTCYEHAIEKNALRRILGDHADNPRVQEWVREFRIFMLDRETWYPGRDAPFWDRLGVYGDLAAHLPMGVDEQGRGPVEPDPAHHYECWCPDPECPLTMALQHAWSAGKRIGEGGYY